MKTNVQPKQYHIVFGIFIKKFPYCKKLDQVLRQKKKRRNSIIISKFIEKMRRKSVKKSSMFKVQADKTVYKKYLDQVSECATVLSYPHLFDSIQRTSQTIFKYCYDFSDQTPFSKGINYGCKNYGLSFPTTNTLVIRQWVPNAKEVYLLADFNEFNQTSHPMTLDEDEKDIYSIELDISKNHIIDESRIVLKIVDVQGKVHKMPPPSCKIRDNDFGYICIDAGLPVMKHQKKHDIIMAYTIDLLKTPLTQVLSFVEVNQKTLSHFNTIIIRSLFDVPAVIDKGSLSLQQMKLLRDIINKIKNQMGLRIIIEWSLEPGTLKHGIDNPIEKQTMKQQGDLWHYDLKKPEVTAIYLANLSYYLSVFQINGFHFKHVDSFCKDQYGQILVKCLNIMNHRLQENGFTLASCKKEVPGLNQPILEGGLGFTFTYNYNQNFLHCKSHTQLRQKFDKILQSSNCVALNLDQLTSEDQQNFLFAVLVSGKGIFCKGSLVDKSDLLIKLLTVRKQPQLFNSPTTITKVSGTTLLAQRGRTVIFFNFGETAVEQKIEKVNEMELICNFSRREPVISQQSIKLEPRSCCVFQQKVPQ